jgi:hypothetical protein
MLTREESREGKLPPQPTTLKTSCNSFRMASDRCTEGIGVYAGSLSDANWKGYSGWIAAYHFNRDANIEFRPNSISGHNW